ncbi:MAG: FAD-binding oxidoreductase [Hyphomicrobiales bacterium]|nr:FAD-binding oxidoreductase [Hyphomicrobiales bacterium]MCP5372430.1 FAD-binding oxidoreductase [Hyphomicrobiales bacterium]
MTRFDAVIVGGGLHGCSLALHLARKGLAVAVVEKNWSGRHASGVNAGGVRTLLRDPAEIPLALAAREIWHDIGSLVDEDCGYRTSGQLAVAETAADMARLEARAADLAAAGYSHEELVDAAELYRLLPALVPGCAGGLIARRDGYASPYHTTRAFRRRAEKDGVTFFQGVRAENFRRADGLWRADAGDARLAAPVIVNCGGAWAGDVARALGDETPLQPKLPMMMVTARTARFVEPVVIGVGRPLSFKQMPNGTVVIGGGYLAAGDRRTETTRLNFSALAKSAATVRDLFPHLGRLPIVRCWAGFEGRTPDDLPIIGPGRRAGVFHACGFSGHGFQLGPVVGRELANLIADGRTDFDLTPFAVDRF